MSAAESLIVVGYAFNSIDSHFNDLFRSTATSKRVAIINPDLENTRAAVCELLGVAPSTLTSMTMSGIQVERSANLLFVPSRCEAIGTDLLAQIRAGW